MSAYFFAGKFTCGNCNTVIRVSTQEDENLVLLRAAFDKEGKADISEAEARCPNCGAVVDAEVREVIANRE